VVISTHKLIEELQ